MTDHPMLARNEVEDDAYCEGVYAEMSFGEAQGYDRIRTLLKWRRAALNDPSAAYNLGNMLAARSDRPARKRMAADLYVHAIGMACDRIADPDASRDWPPKEKTVRRVASMALVNLGNIRQYSFGLREEAHDDYLRAVMLYDGNEIAHLNIGQMNYGGIVERPDGDLAYHHYLKAMAGGIRCKTLRPGCECLVTITDALGAVTKEERTGMLPRIRDAVAHGEFGIDMPSTDGVSADAAAQIESAVDEALSDLDADSPIERRVTRIASMAATIAGIMAVLQTGDNDGAVAMEMARTVVDALRSSSRPADRVLMPQRSPIESATPEACMAMYGNEELDKVYHSIVIFMRRMHMIAGDDPRSGLTHAIKTVFASVSPAWRGGILSTAANGFRQKPISGMVRIAVPGAIGAQNPVDVMRGWAEDPSTIR